MTKQRRLSRSSVAPRLHPRARKAARFTLPELLEARTLLSAYLVSSNADDGTFGTLRDAVAQVNLGNYSEIDFAGPMTIALSSGLQVTAPVTINGLTDASGKPAVVLNGQGAGTGANGLELDGAGSTVSGLVINGFAGDGLLVAGAGVTVQGNFIGTNQAGSVAMPNGRGVEIRGAGNVVSGNLISGNTAEGVLITGNNATVASNLIGTDASGTLALANSVNVQTYGAVVVNGAAGTTIGGTTAAARNIISGNNEDGVAFINCTGAGNVLEGNYIGLDVTGENPLPNNFNGVDLGTTDRLTVENVLVFGNVISANQNNGIFIDNSNSNTIAGNDIGTDKNGDITGVGPAQLPLQGNQANGIMVLNNSTGNVIGGSDAASRNVISGNHAVGIYIDTGSSDTAVTTVIGNYIGTNAAGAGDITRQGNQSDGIDVYSGTTFIGQPGAGNIISANQGFGLYINNNSTILGNQIGVAADGSAMGNLDVGVILAGSNNTLGATNPGEGNVIACNATATSSPAGVMVFGINDSIRGNSIFSNALGIDLGGNGVTPNTPGGPHTGPNNFQNFPVLSGVTTGCTNDMASGTLNSTPGSTFTIDFYSVPSPDAAGYGGGKTYLGSATVTTDGSGNATFSDVQIQANPSGENYFSATATDATGNTSEFSFCMIGVAPSQSGTTTMVSSSMDPSTLGEAVTFAAAVSGNGATPTGTVVFTIDGQAFPAIALDSAGIASMTSAALSVGSHTISAAYSGDAAYTCSTGSLAQQVVKADTTVTISSSAPTSTFGQTVTFTAQVLSTAPGWVPGGTIDFMDGSADLGTATLSVDGSGNVTASLSTTALSVGTHSITAIYYGDGNFNGSMSGPLAQAVNAVGGTISGHTFFDVTGNGLSSDDKPMSGVTVKLYLDSDGNGILDAADGAPVATTVSGAGTGSFTFANVSAGVYFVQEVTPSGYVETAPAMSTFYTVNMSAGAIVSGEDFDNFQTCNCKNDITNVKFVINGYKTVTDLRGQVHQGDVVQVKFTVLSGHCDVFSLVSYTATAPSFNANNASQQSIYQDSTGTFGPGTYTLSVVVPKCYFQVDFVCGYAIDKFGPAGSNVFYSAQGRLISADNGGYCPPPASR